MQQALAKHTDEVLFDRVVYLLQAFANSASATSAGDELKLLAALSAYVHTAAPTLSITQEPTLSDELGMMKPDLIMRDSENFVVVEPKRLRH